MDPKGELLSSVLAHRPVLDRLVLLRPDPEHPLALNPLKASNDVSGLMEYIFGGLIDSGLSDNMSVVFRHVLDLLRQVPNATMRDFLYALDPKIGWKKYAAYVDQVEDPEFFTQGRYDVSHLAATRQAVSVRIDRILSNKVMRDMLMAKECRINMKALMDTNAVVLIDNRDGYIKPEGSVFLGRLFLALIRDAGRQRTLRPKPYHPVHVYIDEADTIIAHDPHVPEIISKCRSQLISLTLAHQNVTQVKEIQPHLEMCAIKFFNTDEEPLERGSFHVSVRPKVKNQVVHFDYVPVDNYERMTDYPITTEAEFQALRQTMWRTYCYDPHKPTSPPEPAPASPSPKPPRPSPAGQRPKEAPTPPPSQKASGTDVSGDWDDPKK
jgi:hypothetical protein